MGRQAAQRVYAQAAGDMPPCRLRALFLGCCLLASSLVIGDARAEGAAVTGEIERLAETAREAIAAADLAEPDRRDEFYETALSSLRVIQKFAEMDSSEELSTQASQELARLRAEGIDPTALAFGSFTAALPDLTAAIAGPELAERQIAAQNRLQAIEDPAYRVSALVEAGYAFLGAALPERARRYAELALDEARNVDETAQAAAYNSVVQLAGRLGTAGDAIVEQALMMLPRARNRGFALYDLARGGLAGTPLAEADGASIATEVRRLIEAGNLSEAANLAMAISPADDAALRSELLESLLAAALEDEPTIALRIAAGFADESDQSDALAEIIANGIDNEQPLRVIAIVESMPSGVLRARTMFMLAAALASSGYDGMADEMFANAGTSADALTGDGRAIALASGISAFADAGRLDDALHLAAAAGESENLSDALGGLAKDLADAGRTPEAQALLPRIAEAEDYAHALSGIGRAQAGSGDIAAAHQSLSELQDPDDVGRVLAAIVREQARRGDFADAEWQAAGIDHAGYRVEAYLSLAKAAHQQGDERLLRVAYEAALDAATLAEERDHDQLLVDIVKSLADAGRTDEALDVAARIQDEDLRDRAEAEVARSLDEQSSLRRGELLRAIGDDRIREEATAAIAVDAASDPARIASSLEAIRSIEDDGIRVAAFRRVAEAQVLRNDAYRHLGGPALDAQPAPAAVIPAGAAVLQPRDVDQLVLTGWPADLTGVDRFQFPSVETQAADVRGAVPLPGSGRSTVTLLPFSPYFSKFLEDNPAGSTSLEQVLLAQGSSSGRMIVVQDGVQTLGSLARDLRNSGDAPLITFVDGIVTLRAPLLVSEGATLVLSGLEASEYRLSADQGAFIVNAGTLYVVDTHAVAYEEALREPAWSSERDRRNFRPFLLGWGGSQTYIAASKLTAFGYASPKSFGLSLSAGPSNLDKARGEVRVPTGVIVDNVIEDFEYGFYSYEAEDVVLLGNEFRNNIVYGVDPHDRSKRLLIGLNTAYGTQLKHGIIVSREVDESWIVGNIAFANHGSGFMLDRDSTNNILFANTAFENGQDGISLFESSCNLLSSNNLFANERAGIKVRNSADVGIYHNSIRQNAQAAIDSYILDLTVTTYGASRDYELDPFTPITSLTAGWNTITDNGMGISSNGSSRLGLVANRFVRQSRKLLGGNLRGLEGQVLSAGESFGLLVASACMPRQPEYVCALREDGILPGEDWMSRPDATVDGDCTDVAGSVQHDAFVGAAVGQ